MSQWTDGVVEVTDVEVKNSLRKNKSLCCACIDCTGRSNGLMGADGSVDGIRGV